MRSPLGLPRHTIAIEMTRRSGTSRRRRPHASRSLDRANFPARHAAKDLEQKRPQEVAEGHRAGASRALEGEHHKINMCLQTLSWIEGLLAPQGRTAQE